MVEVLGLEQAGMWQSVLDESDAYDFYHLPGYHALEEKSPSDKAVLLVYRNGSAMAAFPLIISPLEELGNPGVPPGGWYDATSVYGYPGPICNNKARSQEGFFVQFGQEIVEVFKQMRIVSAFSRLNPVLENHALLKSIGDTVSLGPTVSIDLSRSTHEQLSMFRKDHRDGIKKARLLGMRVYRDTLWEHFDEFLALYEATMKRVHAEKHYFFTPDYFEHLREVLGTNIHLFLAEHDGKIIGGSIFIQTGNIVQYHLSANDLSFRRASGSKLIIDEARLWAKENGARTMHLGGGVGAKEDSLFEFKSGFSSLRHQFVVWQLVVEKEIYEAMVKHHNQVLVHSGHPQKTEDFFPMYRAPRELSLGFKERVKKLNILITSAGRRVYLVNYFKKALGHSGKIIAADMQITAPALKYADDYVILPDVYDPKYVEELLRSCKLKKIDAIISLNDLELSILADHKELVESAGIRLLVSDKDIIDICFDKLKTFGFLTDNSILSPLTYSSVESLNRAIERKEIQFPIVIKPRWGSASIGINFADNIEELLLYKELLTIQLSNSILNNASSQDIDKAILFQEKISGTEYGLDILNDFSGSFVTCVMREKIAMRAGETDKAVIIENPELFNIGKEIATNLRHIGTLDCDVLEKDGKFYVLELNPRFGGGYPFSYEAGVDIPDAYVKWLKGEKPNKLRIVTFGPFAKCDIVIKTLEP
jgi:carbamoyl-phosphate synthase large subunit